MTESISSRIFDKVALREQTVDLSVICFGRRSRNLVVMNEEEELECGQQLAEGAAVEGA